jgi:hypothetical protein
LTVLLVYVTVVGMILFVESEVVTVPVTSHVHDVYHAGVFIGSVVSDGRWDAVAPGGFVVGRQLMVVEAYRVLFADWVVQRAKLVGL